MNVKRLRQVLDYFREEPRRLEMYEWHHGGDQIDGLDNTPPCGTMACIAGAACILGKTAKRSGGNDGQYLAPEKGWDISAKKLLGLTVPQADRLFRPDRSTSAIQQGSKNAWPKKFRTAYNRAKTPEGRLKATMARVENFIKTRGAE